MLSCNQQLDRCVNAVDDEAMNRFGGEHESFVGIVNPNFGWADEYSILVGAITDRAPID
jgi:hypothetical protein